jgi:poly-beta-1,6-N-acetyl-D-glucosamine N-deacetylase
MRFRHILFIPIMLLALHATAVRASESFLTLCYHDIQDKVPPKTAIITLSGDELLAQFSWLKAHGYHPVSLDDLIAARDAHRALPDKAVLLTFDDGYESMYTRVFPLLKLYHFPAVLALVSSWMEARPGGNLGYDDAQFTRGQLLSWDQVREMERSGLVEVASHSHNLHHGVTANPQGNQQAAAVTRIYDPATHRYEDDDHYRRRIMNDLLQSEQIFKRRLGHYPRAVVWPYGAYSQSTVEIADTLDMPITFNLDDGRGDVKHLQTIPRFLIPTDMPLSDFVWVLRNHEAPQPRRVAQVDLDYIYDADPAQQEKNLGKLVERIKRLEINTVYLQAFADPDGDGSADALYFPNRHLPLRADLFDRAAQQLHTRAGVEVYAWLPVLAYKLPDADPVSRMTVQHDAERKTNAVQHDFRLSPFYPQVRQEITDIYEDLAKYAAFDGILFHDDAYLTDHEDNSPAALSYYQHTWGLPGTLAAIRGSPDALAEWTAHKTKFLVDFTDRLAARVRHYRPGIKTARNLYASVILDPAAEEWYAQSFPSFLAHYDYTAVLAMPYLEGAPQPQAWLERLAEHVAAVPGAMPRTVFELQSRNWRTRIPLSDAELAADMAVLRRAGVTNYGYYPDDAVNGRPAIAVIKPQFSLRSNPYR